MSLYKKSYTKALRSYDPDLFVDYNSNGVLCVFHNRKRFEVVVDAPDFKLKNLKTVREYVCAITDTWSTSGRPRDYGIDDVLNHIQKIDSLANAKYVEEMDAHNEKVREIKRKDMRNEAEGMFSYERKRIVKAFDEIAPISRGMSRDEPKKRLKDRSIKNGNYK